MPKRRTVCHGQSMSQQRPKTLAAAALLLFCHSCQNLSFLTQPCDSPSARPRLRASTATQRSRGATGSRTLAILRRATGDLDAIIGLKDATEKQRDSVRQVFEEIPRPEATRSGIQDASIRFEDAEVLLDSRAESQLREDTVQVLDFIGELQPAFKEADNDSDGLISAEQFTATFYNLGGVFSLMSRAEIMDIFTVADVDSDGLVDYHNFFIWMLASQVFASYWVVVDTDCNGAVDIADWRTMASKIYPEWSADHTENTFQKIDLDDNGSINFVEFVYWFGGPEKAMREWLFLRLQRFSPT